MFLTYFLRKATCKRVMVNIYVYIYISNIYIYIYTNHTRSVQYHSNTIHAYVYMYLIIHTRILTTYATYSEICAGTQKGRWNTSSQPFQVTAFVAPATSRPEMTHQVLDVWVEIVWMWMWCGCDVFVSLFFDSNLEMGEISYWITS